MFEIKFCQIPQTVTLDDWQDRLQMDERCFRYGTLIPLRMLLEKNRFVGGMVNYQISVNINTIIPQLLINWLIGESHLCTSFREKLQFNL